MIILAGFPGAHIFLCGLFLVFLVQLRLLTDRAPGVSTPAQVWTKSSSGVSSNDMSSAEREQWTFVDFRDSTGNILPDAVGTTIRLAFQERLLQCGDIQLLIDHDRDVVVGKLIDLHEARALYAPAKRVPIGAFRSPGSGVFGILRSTSSGEELEAQLIELRTGTTRAIAHVHLPSRDSLSIVSRDLADTILLHLSSVTFSSVQLDHRELTPLVSVLGSIRFRPHGWMLYVFVKPPNTFECFPQHHVLVGADSSLQAAVALGTNKLEKGIYTIYPVLVSERKRQEIEAYLQKAGLGTVATGLPIQEWSIDDCRILTPATYVR